MRPFITGREEESKSPGESKGRLLTIYAPHIPSLFNPREVSYDARSWVHILYHRRTVMITCNNCGRVNDESMRICRFCGTVLERPRRQTGAGVREYSPPADGVTNIGSGPEMIAPYSPPTVANGYHCPNCWTTYPPVAEKRISGQGWIVFVAFLILCLPLSILGLFMKEELRVCPMCRHRLA
jgi:hypothetical protein